MRKVLSSKWDGLNSSLLASVFPVDSGGNPIAGGPIVRAPFIEANLEATANWQSPFEQSGIENSIPSLSALIQSGAGKTYADLFGVGGVNNDDSFLGRMAGAITEAGATAYAATVGRSGLTKLNSQQIFTGAMPVKLTATMLFRAFDTPTTEVAEPVDQVIRWTLARELAQNGALVQSIQNLSRGQGLLKSAFPSLTPTMVGVTYCGVTLAPMVIESVSKSMTVPRYRDGNALQEQVQVTFGTLTALDENDWVRARRGAPIKLFNN